MSIFANKIIKRNDEYTGENTIFYPATILPNGNAITDMAWDDTIIKKNIDGTYSMRKYGKEINVKWYNVAGDGITDDTAAINYAIANCPVNATLFFPTGTYLISGSLAVTDKINIKLEADQNTIITYPNATSNVNGFILSNCTNVTVEGFTINGTAFAKQTGSGYYAAIMLIASNRCTITNNYINNFSGFGIYLAPLGTTGCSYNNITHNRVIKCYGQNSTAITDYVTRYQDLSGIMLGYSGTGYFHTNNNVEYNYVDGGQLTSHGIALIGHGYNNKFRHNRITNCLSYGVVVYESAYGDGIAMLVYNNEISSNIIDSIGVPNANVGRMLNYLAAFPTQNALATSTTGGILPAATTYFVIVTAVTASGETIWKSEQSITTGAGVTNSINVSWSASVGAVSYNVYIGTTSLLESTQFNTTATTLTITDLALGAEQLVPVIVKYGQGIYGQKAHRSIVQANYVTNTCINSNLSTLAIGGINMNGGMECVVQNNVVDTSGYNGIVQSYNYGGTVSNNKVYNCANYGIANLNSSNVVIENNTVYNCVNTSLYSNARYLGDEDIQTNVEYYLMGGNATLGVSPTYSGRNVIIKNNYLNQPNNAIALAIAGVAAGASVTLANAQLLIKGNRIIAPMYGINGDYFENTIIAENILEISNTTGIAVSCNTHTNLCKANHNYIIAAAGSIATGILMSGTNSYQNNNIISGTASYPVNINGNAFGNDTRTMYGNAPALGTWNVGDKCYTNNGRTEGYICTVAGTPGTWTKFGRTGGGFTSGTTAQRPTTLTSTDVGWEHFDTTINRMVFWSGVAWLDPTAPATLTSLGTVLMAAAVANSTDTTNVAIQFNALLAALRTAGIISN